MPEKRHTRNRLREFVGGKLKGMPGAMELLEQLLVLDPKKRISAEAVLFEV